MASADGLRRAHLWVGWLMLAVFLATGHYMRFLRQPPVEELEPGLRMLSRSRHIYLLFAGLLNLLAARPGLAGRPEWLQLLGSGLLILAPWMMLAAFYVETAVLLAPTALSITAVQAALAGALCYLLAGWLARRE